MDTDYDEELIPLIPEKLPDHKQSSLKTVITHVLSSVGFFACLSLLITKLDKEGDTKNQYPLLFSLTAINMYVSTIIYLFNIKDSKKITKKDMLYNIYMGFMNIVFISLLVYSSNTYQTRFDQQALFILASFVGYLMFSIVHKFQGLQFIEVILGLSLFVITIMAGIYNSYKGFKSDNTYSQIFYYIAHVFNGAHSAIMENMWCNNKVDRRVNYFLTSLITMMGVLCVSGFDMFNNHDRYIDVWKDFGSTYKDMFSDSVNIVLSLLVLISCPVMTITTAKIHLTRKSSLKHLFEISIPVLIYIIALSTSGRLSTPKILEMTLVPSSAIFFIGILIGIFKLAETVRRHKKIKKLN